MFRAAIPVLVVLIPLNMVVLIFGFRWLGRIYSARFEALTAIVTEAVNYQRAELGAFKGRFLKEVLSHDQAFDELVNLNAEELESEGNANGHESDS